MQWGAAMKNSWYRIRTARACFAVFAAAWFGSATATQPAGCNVSTQSVAFGNYSSRSTTPTDSLGNVQVTCSGTTGQAVSYTIQISSGAGGSFFPRKMSGGAGTLIYNLYTDATHVTIWGDGNSGTFPLTDMYSLTASTTVRNYTVYGRIFSGQNASVGVYTDNLTVTVNY
jgi:spore coat protein U-like protein